MTLYSWLKAIHLIAAVLWVGGLGFAWIVLRPSVSVLDGPQRIALHGQVYKRFFLVIWHAIPLLLITGFWMLGALGGMAGVPWNVHAMVALGLLMTVVFLWVVFGPYRSFRGTEHAEAKAGAMASIRMAIGINLVLGLLTVLVAGLI
ncbi:MAG: CopD family protein [Rhodospirillales bacterium]|nr:CopD family protein [Rhodospirillales bacterium]MBN8896626.1 CopD family protein [Rhodospirillales bacterium]MBN8903528.1 CopD family protein [Rhodospirillales bacterium]